MAIKPHWFHILVALAEEPLHGADIRRRVREHTSGELRLYPAMLYGSLEDMESRGWIREVDEGDGRPFGENERRRYYRMTGDGRTALAEETARLESLSHLARGVL